MKKIVALLLLLNACAAPRPVSVTPPRFNFGAVADSIILTSDLSQTLWGIEVFDPARNRTLYSYNGTRHFIPASNTKLAVTTVAMGSLGPNYRYQTNIFASGPRSDTLPDRLVVVGSGDPTWSARFHGSPFAVLEQLADSVLRMGIRGLRRELIIDASFFGPERVHSTWEVGDLPFSSAAPVAAFAIGEGLMQVELRPGPSRGAPATAHIVGPIDAFPIRAAVVTDTTENTDVDYQAWPDSILISGRIRSDRPDTTTIATPDAARFAALAFRDALVRRGIAVPAVRIVYDSLEARQLRDTAQPPLISWTSQPMSAIVAAILQPSQNWIAEQVVKTLGGLKRGRGTWSNGIEAERRYLVDIARVDSTAFFLRDASGLSAQNLLAPNAIIRMLDHVRQQPWGATYRQGMPSPMLPRSTLSNRLAGLEGKVFAKTGTITNVNSLSGYITTASGRELIFSIMTNASGRPSAQVRRAIDHLVQTLALERQWDER